MSSATAVTAATFQEQVITSKKPVVVDFWAEWCGPCKFLNPTLDELATEYGERINFLKVNVDEEPSLSQQYGVMSIPTILFFRHGKIVDSTVGALAKDDLKPHLEKLLV